MGAISGEKPGDEERASSAEVPPYFPLAPQVTGGDTEAASTPGPGRRRALGGSSQAEPAAFSQKAFSVDFMKPPRPLPKEISPLRLKMRCYTSKTLIKVEMTSHHHGYSIFEAVLLLPD